MFRPFGTDEIVKKFHNPVWYVGTYTKTPESAEEMRALSEKSKEKEHAKEFTEIIAKIQKAATQGRNFVTISEHISDYIRNKLVGLGYSIESSAPGANSVEVSW